MVGLIGVSAFAAGLALSAARREWRFSPWTLGLVVVGASLMALGSRIWLTWFAETHGKRRVPTWLAFLVLSGLALAFLLYALVQGLSQ
jgi:drug/metabolite transporter (DMT)-like permease